MKRVEFLFDFGSPTTYLAYTQLPKIATKTGAEIIWTPILLGGIFKAAGNSSPVTIPAKAKWMLDDLQRFATRYGVPLTFNPHFPINTLPLMRGAAGYLSTPLFARYVDLMFRAMWVEGKNLGDASVADDVLRDAGLDPAAFHSMIERADVKDALKRNTDRAVERGVFGAPTFFIGDEMHFGQDRLDFVEDALR